MCVTVFAFFTYFTYLQNTAHSADLGPLYCRLCAARSHTSPSSEARSPMADWW